MRIIHSISASKAENNFIKSHSQYVPIKIHSVSSFQLVLQVSNCFSKQIIAAIALHLVAIEFSIFRKLTYVYFKFLENQVNMSIKPFGVSFFPYFFEILVKSINNQNMSQQSEEGYTFSRLLYFVIIILEI
jgi:hypothetical protein